MGTQLKNIVRFVGVQPHDTVVLPHKLNENGRPAVPDILISNKEDVDLTANDVNITLENIGPEPLDIDVLAEHWHTIERAFGDSDVLALSPQPFVVRDSGNIPQPPWTGFSQIVIYARLTGSDATGTGTFAKPYRTFQRCVRDVPTNVPAGVGYVIDITGIGIETLPSDYTLPAWKGSTPPIINFVDPVTGYQAFVNIRATPKLAGSASRVTINGADIASVINNPDTGLDEVTLTGPAQASKLWGVDEWKGKLFFGAFANDEGAVVAKNTASKLYLTTLNSGITAPFTIQECSAILEGRNVTPNFDGGGINVNNCDNISFGGIGMRPDDGFSLGIEVSGGWPVFRACQIVSFGGADPNRQIQINGCFIEGGFIEGVPLITGSLITVGSFGGFFLARPANVETVLFVTWWEGGPVAFFGVASDMLLASNLSIAFCQFIGTGANPGPGIHFTGGNALIQFTRIDGCTDEGILADQGMGLVQLVGVKGAGNGGPGIRVNDGMSVKKDPGTTLTGSVDQHVGDLAAGAYPANPFSIFDVTMAGGVGGAMGTGSRLFDPTP